MHIRNTHALAICAALATLATAGASANVEQERPVVGRIVRETGNAVDGAVSLAGDVAGGAVGLAGNVVDGAANLAGNAVDGAANLAGNVVDGTANLAGDALRGTANLAGDVVRGTANVAGDAVRGVTNVAGDAVRGTVGLAGDAVRGVTQTAGRVVGGTLNAAETVVGGTLNAAENVVGGAVNVTKDVVGGVTGVAGNVVGGTLNAAENVVGGAVDATKNVVGGVTNVAGNVVGGAVDVAGNVVGGVTNVAGNVVGGAANLTKDVVGGAVNVAGGVVGGAANVAGKAVDKAAEATKGAVGKVRGMAQSLLRKLGFRRDKRKAERAASRANTAETYAMSMRRARMAAEAAQPVTCTTAESSTTVASGATDVPQVIFPVAAADDSTPSAAPSPASDCARLMTRKDADVVETSSRMAAILERHGGARRNGQRYVWYHLNMRPGAATRPEIGSQDAASPARFAAAASTAAQERAEDLPRGPADVRKHMAAFKAASPQVFELLRTRMAMAHAARDHVATLRGRMAKVVRLYEERMREEQAERVDDDALAAKIRAAEERIAQGQCGESKACTECHGVARDLVSSTQALVKRTRDRAARFRRRVARWAQRSFMERAALFHQLRMAQVRDAVGAERTRALQAWYLRKIHDVDARSQAHFRAVLAELRRHEQAVLRGLEQRIAGLQSRVGGVAQAVGVDDASLRRVVAGQADIARGVASIDARLERLASSVLGTARQTPAASASSDDQRLAIIANNEGLLNAKLDALHNLLRERAQSTAAAPSAGLVAQLRELTALIRERASSSADQDGGQKAAEQVDGHVRELGQFVESHVVPMQAAQKALSERVERIATVIERMAAAPAGAAPNAPNAEEAHALEARVDKLAQSVERTHAEHAAMMRVVEEGRDMVRKVLEISAHVPQSTDPNSPRVDEHVLLSKLMLKISDMVTHKIAPMTIQLVDAARSHATELAAVRAAADKCACKSCDASARSASASADANISLNTGAVVKRKATAKAQAVPAPTVRRVLKRTCVTEAAPPAPGAAPAPVPRKNRCGCVCDAPPTKDERSSSGRRVEPHPLDARAEADAARDDWLNARDHADAAKRAADGPKKTCRVEVAHVVEGTPAAKAAVDDRVHKCLASKVKADGAILARINEVKGDMGYRVSSADATRAAAAPAPRGSDLLF